MLALKLLFNRINALPRAFLGLAWLTIIGFIFSCSNETSSELACTAACLQNSQEKYVLKSYDWKKGHGAVFVNKKGVAKVARLPSLVNREGVRWTARYGSVTFSQIAKDFPFGGMNEQGLVVEVLWLDSTVYPDSAAKGKLNQFQWVQYQLDTAASLADARRNIQTKLSVVNAGAKVHYLVCEKAGNCLVFQYLKTGPTIIEGSAVRALTNNEYRASRNYAESADQQSSERSSLARFATADDMAKSFHSTNKLDDVKRIFTDYFPRVWRKNRTRWNIMYDPSSLKIYFRTAENLGVVKEVDLSPAALDYSCLVNAMMLDMNEAAQHPSQQDGFYLDNVTLDFEWFSESAHNALVDQGLQGNTTFYDTYFKHQALYTYEDEYTSCALPPQPKKRMQSKVVRSLTAAPYAYTTCCVCEEEHRQTGTLISTHVGEQLGLYPAVYGSSANASCSAFEDTWAWTDEQAGSYYNRSNCRLQQVRGQSCAADAVVKQIWNDELNEWNDFELELR